MEDFGFVDSILEAEDKAAADLEKEFLRSVKVSIKQIDWDKLESELVLHHSAEEIADDLPIEGFDPDAPLKKLFETVLEIHGEYIGSVTGGAIFDYVDPNALKWIESHGADLVVQVTQKTKEAIREIVKYGYDNGLTPKEQGKLIRELVGLDPPRARTYRQYVENLRKRGLSEARIKELAEKRYQKLLTARGNTIAVNETSNAAGQATYQSTKSAVERGVIDPNLYEGFRIVTFDERTCGQCSPLSGEARKLPSGTYPSTGSNTAKVHIKCRCVEGLREIGSGKKGDPRKKNKPLPDDGTTSPDKPVALVIPGKPDPNKVYTKPEPIPMKKKEMKESGKVTTDIIFEAKALKRKDGVIYCPTVPLVEGVFDGLGFPVLRLYEEFSKDAKWLNGLTVLTNHEDLNPNARRIGQLSDSQARPEKKDVAATTQFFEIDLTQREIEAITSRQPIHGSLSLSYNLEEASGTWNGKQYVAIERGPYVFYEYSMVKQGVVTPADGAGFNMECRGCNHNHSAPGGADMEIEEMKQAIEEAIAPLKGQIATLEQKNTELQGKLDSMEQKAEADRSARVFEAFQSKLKPGHQEKAKEHFEAYQKDPASWALANSDKFIQAGRERQLSGRASTEGGDIPGVTRPYTSEEMTAKQAEMAKKVA